MILEHGHPLTGNKLPSYADKYVPNVYFENLLFYIKILNVTIRMVGGTPIEKPERRVIVSDPEPADPEY